jgi:hypothetical protein
MNPRRHSHGAPKLALIDQEIRARSSRKVGSSKGLRRRRNHRPTNSRRCHPEQSSIDSVILSESKDPLPSQTEMNPKGSSLMTAERESLPSLRTRAFIALKQKINYTCRNRPVEYSALMCGQPPRLSVRSAASPPRQNSAPKSRPCRYLSKPRIAPHRVPLVIQQERHMHITLFQSGPQPLKRFFVLP